MLVLWLVLEVPQQVQPKEEDELAELREVSMEA